MLLAFLTMMAAAKEPRVPPANSFSHFRFSLADGFLTLGTVAYTVIPLIDDPSGYADPAGLLYEDGWGTGQVDGLAAAIRDNDYRDRRAVANVSDGFLWGSVGVAGVYGIGHIVAAAWDVKCSDKGDKAGCWVATRHAAAPLAVLTETITIGWVLNDVVKHAVERPRPYVYACNQLIEDGQASENAAFCYRQYERATGSGETDFVDSDRSFSFYSGHTGTTATATFGVASVILIEFFPRRFGPAVIAYGTAGLTTATVGALRMGAGKHFLSDVLVGGAMGAGIGVLVPELHAHRIPVPTVAVIEGGAVVSMRGAL